jgi:hypothetical protein
MYLLKTNQGRRVSVALALMLGFRVEAADAQLTATLPDSVISSIEIAAATYAKANVVGAKRVVFDPRVRTERGLTDARPDDQALRLAAILGATIGRVECPPASRPCTPLGDAVGVAIQKPLVVKQEVQVTIEIHVSGGIGSETIALARAVTGWRVTRRVMRSAS